MVSSLTTNVDIYIYIYCRRRTSKTSCRHPHVIIEEEAIDEKLLSPRLNDDEMTSIKVAAC